MVNSLFNELFNNKNENYYLYIKYYINNFNFTYHISLNKYQNYIPHYIDNIIILYLNLLNNYDKLSGKIFKLNINLSFNNLKDFYISQDMSDHIFTAKYKFNYNYKKLNNYDDIKYKFDNIIYGYGNTEFILTYLIDKYCINDKDIIYSKYISSLESIKEYFNNINNYDNLYY